MAKGFDNLHIKSAVRGRSNVKFDKLLLTTMNIGEIVPSHIMELVPSDKINIHHDTFARLAPMPVPSYVKLFYKTASFFVPFHQVMDGADSFIAGQTTYNGHIHQMRYFTLEDLFTVFYNLSNSVQSGGFDWKFTNSAGVVNNMRFTPLGKHCYKVLKNLGYEIPRGIDNRTSSTWSSSYKLTKVSALPFLCYVKAYMDWMSNSVRYNTDALCSIMYDIKVNASSTTYYSTDGHVKPDFITYAINQIRLNYDTNYFTGAWETPNSPINQYGNITSISFPYSPTVNGSVNSGADNVTTAIQGGTINERALQYLARFQSWVRRNNFVGTKDVEMILSRMGVKIDDYKVRFAYRLGMTSTPVQIGDVTATANSLYPTPSGNENFAIGDYVGKGILNTQKNTDTFTSSDYGFYVQIAWIAPQVQYSQGFDHHVLHMTPTDFYTPEFDQMQASPIPVMEVAQCNKKQTTNNNIDGTAVFGFVPKYSEYLYQRDVVSGDMLLSEGYDAWHFNRDLSAEIDTAAFKAQSVTFNQIPVNDTEFNRIFDVTDDSEDKFIIASRFETVANRPMLSLSDKADLGDGGLDVQRNGTQIN